MGTAWEPAKPEIQFLARPSQCIVFIEVEVEVEVEVEDEVNLRLTVSRPVCPGVRRSSGTCDPFFFRHEISCRQLRFCYFIAPSLTGGRVCNLLVQLLLGLARAVTLEPKSHRTHGHILLSQLRLPQPGGPGSRIYISQEQGGPVIPPGTGWCLSLALNLPYSLSLV
jgi:hypothetical protein